MAGSFFQSLQATGFFTYIRDSVYAYPVLLSLHIVALIVLGGMVLVTDLRRLGVGMQSYSVTDIVNGLRVPKRIGFAVAAGCGVLLFGAKAGLYSHHPWFWIKIALLALVGANYLLFRRGVYENSGAKLAAGFSLLLWTGVLWAARGPATVKDIMHSMVDPSADFVFESVQTIADQHGITEIAPRTAAEWDDVRQHLQALLDAQDLLTAPGRRAAQPKVRSNNPQVENQPAEVQALLDAERPDFIVRARRLKEAALVAMKAVDAKDKDALSFALDGIDKACESCHLHYWYPRDTRAREAAKEDGVIE